MPMKKSIAAAVLTIAGTAPAAAHHVMGKLPSTFVEGLLSGFGHPVIGLDHFAALVAVGCIASFLPRGGIAAIEFAIAAIAGVVLQLGKANLPAGEILVAITVIALGLVAVWSRAMPPFVAGLLFAVAGLVHGYALGESIVGAEPAPVYAYLLGLAVVQSALVIAVMLLARLVTGRLSSVAPVRMAGAFVAAFGVFALMQQFVA